MDYIEKTTEDLVGSVADCQPNDSVTRAQVIEIVSSFLEDVKKRKCINVYKVICDESINSPEQINNGELHFKVVLDFPEALYNNNLKKGKL